MSVSDGQKSSAETFNNAFVSKTVDSEVQAVITLNDTSDPDSGNEISNLQEAVNEIFDSVGIAAVGDSTKDNYANQNFISNGDSRKTAIGKLDAQLQVITAAIPVAGNAGQVLAKNSSTDYDTTWITPNTPTKVTKAYTDFSTAALSNSIVALTIAAGSILKSITVKHSTAFAGTSITAATLSVGLTGDHSKFVSEFDVFQSVANTTFEIEQIGYIGSFGATTDIYVTLTSVGANLSALTAGSVDIYFETTALF